MAAIMPRSLTPLLLLLLAATVPATLAVRPAGDAIAKKCDGGTAAIMECIDVLNRNPDGVPPRRLAELAYSYLVKDGEALYKETQAALVTTPEEYRSTVASLNFTMKFYYDSVVRFVPEESKKRFDEAKSNLDEILNRMPPPSTGTIDITKVPIADKVGNYEELQKVTLGLMGAADAPPEDPKKEEAAKSVKAPAA